MAEENPATAHVKAEDLHDFARRAFVSVGVPDNDADITADSMVEASLRGEGDHGARLIPIWCQKIKEGGTNPVPPSTSCTSMPRPRSSTLTRASAPWPQPAP